MTSTRTIAACHKSAAEQVAREAWGMSEGGALLTAAALLRVYARNEPGVSDFLAGIDDLIAPRLRKGEN